MQANIYIVGPMIDFPECNFSSFHAVAEERYAALNPATLLEGLSQDHLMDICLFMIKLVNTVVLFSGQSAVERAKYHYAKKFELNLEELTRSTNERSVA